MVNIRNRWCKLSPSLPMYLQGNSWTKLYRNSRTKTIIVIYPIIPHIGASAYIGINIAWHLYPALLLKFELSCVCVCVCVCVYVCVCVCVSVCAYVHSPWRLHLSGSVGMSGNRSTMLCWRCFFPLPSPFITTLKWSIKPF